MRSWETCPKGSEKQAREGERVPPRIFISVTAVGNDSSSPLPHWQLPKTCTEGLLICPSKGWKFGHLLPLYGDTRAIKFLALAAKGSYGTEAGLGVECGRQCYACSGRDSTTWRWV